MPKIDKNRILGNYGSNLVAYTLSKLCLVRPVAEGTDIGIDLYCETIEEGQGFLHFWAQVKSGTQIEIRKNGNAYCTFKTDHLLYWNRQPVPVLAFYVSTKYPPQTPKHIFVANISQDLLINGIPNSKAKEIESHFKISPDSDSWHHEFVSRVKLTSSLLKLREDGILSSIPELTPNYVQKYLPLPGSSRYAKKSLKTIRLTVSSLIEDAALLKYKTGEDPSPDFFDRLITILRIFEEGKRPEIMKALALWAAIIEQDLGRASELVKIGIASIDADPKLDEATRQLWRQGFDPVNDIIRRIEPGD